ncbi:hypothetical protein ASPTUDRAFT_551685 [Aspergillus tubingensis CBS 134.48]|uniref:Transcription initiation factor TFIID subunit 9 n=1 Tax=Aspergillus tubingensis (strain CBS 134.48) TaxID=767770 RepID=A0A1L9N6Z7_ASPTC|nr:hypothetical protein ASPTUDRAFT_551685 [Aspergillus tubingensis CBS 134.48]
MASPNHAQPPTTQPITPPAEPSSTQPTASQNTTTTTTAPAAPTTTTATNNPSTAPAANTNPSAQPTQIPSTSLKDSGKSRRPRDVRLIHMLLSSLGVTAYQERVPLQLLDFAYRYTSSVLQDAVHLATEGYAGGPEAAGGGGSSRAGASEINTVSLPALRLAIASRLHYQFQAGLPKEFLMDVAAERNRVALPGASRGFDSQGMAKTAAANQSVVMGGMRLPPERFCLTGTGWNMREEVCICIEALGRRTTSYYYNYLLSIWTGGREIQFIYSFFAILFLFLFLPISCTHHLSSLHPSHHHHQQQLLTIQVPMNTH